MTTDVERMLAPGGAWYNAGAEYVRDRLLEWLPVLAAEARLQALDEALALVTRETTGVGGRVERPDGDYTIVLGDVEKFRQALRSALAELRARPAAA